MNDVASAIATARQRIADACERAGRAAEDVTVIAVTKGQGSDAIEAALASAITDIGENRVQEAEAKVAAVGERARWHMIGHLQTNKALKAAQLFSVVQSVDSLHLADHLAAAVLRTRKPLEVMIEVDFTDATARTGAAPELAKPLAERIIDDRRLRLTGLMTIAPANDAGAARRCFQQARELRDELQHELACEIPHLSMGMSDDFEIAVEEGATMVRLGRALFGTRSAP